MSPARAHVAAASHRALRVVRSGATVASLSLIAAVALGPVEGRLFPVLVDQEVLDVAVDGRSVEWTWKFRKAREAAPGRFELIAYVNGTGPFLLTPTRLDGSALSGPPVPAGQERSVRLRAQLPDVGSAPESVTVQPMGLYVAPYEPWYVAQVGAAVTWDKPVDARSVRTGSGGL